MYKIGDEIIHNTFGQGKVTGLDNNVIEIRFFNDIDRKFDINILYNKGIVRKL